MPSASTASKSRDCTFGLLSSFWHFVTRIAMTVARTSIILTALRGLYVLVVIGWKLKAKAISYKNTGKENTKLDRFSSKQGSNHA